MSIRAKKFVLYGKIEADYGQDPTCAVTDVLTVPQDSPPVLKPVFNPQAIKVGSKYEFYDSKPGHQLEQLSFDIPLTKAIVNGTAGELTNLLIACGWGLKTGEDNEFDIIFEQESDNSMWFEYYHDGLKEVISGARGSASFRLEAGMFPMVHFEFQGLYNSVAAAAVPSITTYKHGTIFAVKANTLKITDVSYNSFILEFADGNTLGVLRDANATEGVYQIDIADSEPRGSINALIDTTNASTLEGLIENSTSSTILFEAVPAGSGDGKNPVITLTVKFEDYTREAVEGRLYYTMPFVITAIDIDLEFPV